MTPIPIQSLYPHNVVPRGYTSIYFGENQLSLRLIRLSLLPTAHPIGFQPKRVRSSTQFNPRFNLAMGRSRSFGSAANDIVALFRLGFPAASVLKTLTSRWRQLAGSSCKRHAVTHCHKGHSAPTACKHMVSGSHTSPRRGSSHLSVALLFAIGRQRVFSLTGWSPWIQPGFHVTRLTQVSLESLVGFCLRDCHPLWSLFP